MLCVLRSRRGQDREGGKRGETGNFTTHNDTLDPGHKFPGDDSAETTTHTHTHTHTHIHTQSFFSTRQDRNSRSVHSKW